MTTPLPHLVTSAVVLDAGGTHALLVRVGEYRRWGLPGGHVEGGESLVESARRQVREQVGLAQFHVVEPHVSVQQDLVDCGFGEARHVDHTFAAVADAAEPVEVTPADEAGSADRGWYALTALPEPLAPGVRMLVRAAVREAFGG